MSRLLEKTALLGNLQQTLLGCVALPLILAAALFIRVVFEQANTLQESLLKSDLELIARAIQGPVTEALVEEDVQSLEASLASVFSIGRVYGASVFDEEGMRIAAAGVAERNLVGSRITRELADSGQTQEAYREVQGRSVFSHFMPLFDRAGQSRGFIQITRRETDFTHSLETLTWLAWGLWAVLALVIVGTVLAGHYSGVGRHLNHLLKGMAEIARGQLEQRFANDGPREVRALADGLNDMLDGLQQRERELEKRRLAEQALQLKLRDNEALATVGRITRGFAHELGAPLSVIEGRARRLARRHGEDDRDLEAIRRQVQQLTRTVHDLLHYSRPAAATQEIVDIQALVESSVALVHEELAGEATKLDWQPGEPGQRVEGDQRRLQLALLNVIRNGLQACNRRVQVSLRPEAGGVAIAVEDDGPGFPPDAERLLEPFHTTRASGEGTGLGLAITASILNEHGGSLRLENAGEHGGGRVTLWLPASRNGEVS